jgi:hypothetical protein
VLHGRDIAELYNTLYERAQHGQLHQPGNPEAKIGQLELIQLALRPLYKPDWPAAAEFLAQLETGQVKQARRPGERRPRRRCRLRRWRCATTAAT